MDATAHGHGADHRHGHTHDHPHGHSHAPKSLRALLGVITLTTVIFLAELTAGFVSGSLALLSDAMHMLSDSTGLILALVAMLIGRRAPSKRATYGHRRVEVLAALVNALAVSAISVYIVYEAVRRLGSAEEIDVPVMLAVATIGLVANGVSATILVRRQHDSLNMRGAYLHVLSDLLGSVAVIVAGVVIWVTGFTPADTIASFVIAALVLPRSLRLLAASVNVLLERAPADVDVEEIAGALEAVDGVVAVHDLHLWSTDGTDVLATCHLVVDAEDMYGCGVLDDAQDMLAGLGVTHSTIQLEQPGHERHEHVC
ncbi:cobalt-zinc-cadmium resistance protein [Corynebacterium frankenforstense DSM 45800]|uniref:Cobalt-zinc-cadmium resistance protein n=1 Tax=Corynebacterium frankenforstense DSM 45800 TaxID=1437875 RepID=A0A1L7CT20_9CORY|nr:cation diffusion facilitator family transporter [Corynebacterium frankenforstense]APT88977.1 cobalt-zinc-cadmium resistance protein [Corynebacterium frankenforstense DSM 45800]